MKSKILSLFILYLCLFNTGLAQQVYVINKDHSQIKFEIDYLKISSIQGNFQEFSGEVVLDEDLNPQNVKLQIISDSITTFEKKRDSHLKKRDFLAVANYPTITFSSTGVAQMKGQKGKIPGILKFLEKEHPIELQFELLGRQVDPWGKKHVFYRTFAELDRKKLGIQWNKVLDQGGFLIGDKIQITATIQLQPEGDKTAFSTHMIPAPPSGSDRKPLPKKSLEEIKEEYSQTEPKVKKDPNELNPKTLNEQQSKSLQISAWQWVQVGLLSFFSLFGAISIGVGMKYMIEKTMPQARFRHLAEVVFILLICALSSCLYTLITLLLGAS